MFYDDTDFLCHMKKCLLNKEYNFEFKFDNLVYNNKNNRKMFIEILYMLEKLELNCDNNSLILKGKINNNISTDFSETDTRILKGSIWKYEIQKEINKNKKINFNMEEPKKKFLKNLPLEKDLNIKTLYDNLKYLGINCKLEDNETCKIVSITNTKLNLDKKTLKNIYSFIKDFDILSVFSNYNYKSEEDILKGFRIIIGYSKEIKEAK